MFNASAAVVQACIICFCCFACVLSLCLSVIYMHGRTYKLELERVKREEHRKDQLNAIDIAERQVAVQAKQMLIIEKGRQI